MVKKRTSAGAKHPMAKPTGASYVLYITYKGARARLVRALSENEGAVTNKESVLKLKEGMLTLGISIPEAPHVCTIFGTPPQAKLEPQGEISFRDIARLRQSVARMDTDEELKRNKESLDIGKVYLSKLPKNVIPLLDLMVMEPDWTPSALPVDSSDDKGDLPLSIASYVVVPPNTREADVNDNASVFSDETLASSSSSSKKASSMAAFLDLFDSPEDSPRPNPGNIDKDYQGELEVPGGTSPEPGRDVVEVTLAVDDHAREMMPPSLEDGIMERADAYSELQNEREKRKRAEVALDDERRKRARLEEVLREVWALSGQSIGDITDTD